MDRRNLADGQGLGSSEGASTAPSEPRPAARSLSRLLLVLALLVVSGAEAGHEATFYPSFYPHEIRIETIDAATAATRLPAGTLHAYVGSDPFDSRSLPAGLGAVESLGSYLVATFNTAGPLGDSTLRCASVPRAARALGASTANYIFHPYPITPYDADYLQHVDLVEAARHRYRANDASGPSLRVVAKGALAERLIGSRSAGTDADVTVEEVDVRKLLSLRTTGMNGWVGPPWIKQGWFRAHLLLAGTISDVSVRRTAEATYQRLVTGEYRDVKERHNLERALVSLLARGCERVVVGYSVRREVFNADYSEGVENVGADSLTGLNSAIFIRTAKLKDFPWNGWLRLGIESAPAAAWNPAAGFTDAAGRLIWAALGDPALLSAPYGGSWIPNRVTSTVTTREPLGIDVPPDAVIPQPGTGSLQPVGRGKTARAKVVYRVLASAFHDGSRVSVADLLYPVAFAYRWGAPRGADAGAYDPVIAESTALAREWLAGLRVAGIETIVRAYGEDLKYSYEVPVVEVFLTRTSTDAEEAASVAPPWSRVPWHVLALMEEAVTRGLAALSEREATRRGLPWLDLARDPMLSERLAALVERLSAEGYIPGPLASFITAAEARERWRGLKQFYDRHGHFLVTNGPYRLDTWSSDSVTLQAFRDPSYPLGVGAFDRYSIPLRAYASRIDDRGDHLEIHADVETVSRHQRTYEIIREPLRAAPTHDADPSAVVCRYVIIGAGGAIIDEGAPPARDDGGFRVPLAGLRPGDYAILIALYLDGNAVTPEVRVLRHRVRAGS